VFYMEPDVFLAVLTRGRHLGSVGSTPDSLPPILIQIINDFLNYLVTNLRIVSTKSENSYLLITAICYLHQPICYC
jgi:hypothetical protein